MFFRRESPRQLSFNEKITATKSPEQLADRLMPVVDGLTGRDIIKAGQKRKHDEATKQLAAIEKAQKQASEHYSTSVANAGTDHS